MLKKKSNAGAKSKLTQELTLKIRDAVLDNKKYKDIRKELGINENNWDTWVFKDFQGFRADLQNWKHERMVKKAEKQLNILITSDDERVSLNASQFTLSRLNKKKYSDRVEHTGADGKDLTMQNFLIQLDESETKTKGQEVED